MAWSVIADSVLQVGRPIRALTMRLLRDNLTALANGDSGAPRIQNAALADFVITSNKIGGGHVHWWHLRVGNEERDWVLGRLSALDAGAVGGLAWAQWPSSGTITLGFGSVVAGSSLQPAGLGGGPGVNFSNSGTLPGTWRSLGYVSGTYVTKATLFIRIA